MVGYLVGYIYLVLCSSSFTFSVVFFLGLYGQPNAKKLKIMKQQPDSAYDITPNGSIPSPVGSQMSNMPNPSKIIRLIHGSDKGRKAKTPKVFFVYLFVIFCLIMYFTVVLALGVIETSSRCLLVSLLLVVHGHYLKIRLTFGIFS